jgi:predicted dehydrogenase
MKTIGIIGLGQMGMIHAKNLKGMGCTVYTHDTADPTSHGLDLMQDADAIVIATPSDQHTVDMYCHFQSKHLFVEKPIGTSQSCVTDIKAMLAAGDKVVMTGNNMRYHPVVKMVKERMHELGGPYQGAWFLLHQEKRYCIHSNPHACTSPDCNCMQETVDSVILNWGAHEVDLALYLLDRKLTPSPGALVTHDTAEFTLRFNSGPLVHFDLSYNGPNDRCFTIHGPNASIFADLDNFVVHIHSKDGREIIAVAGSHDQTYKDEMVEFLRRIDGHPSDGIGATGAEGLKCLELLLEVQKS